MTTTTTTTIPPPLPGPYQLYLLYLGWAVTASRLPNCDSSWSCKHDGEEAAKPQVVG